MVEDALSVGPQQIYVADSFQSFLYVLHGDLLDGRVQRPFSPILVHRPLHFSAIPLPANPAKRTIFCAVAISRQNLPSWWLIALVFWSTGAGHTFYPNLIVLLASLDNWYTTSTSLKLSIHGPWIASTLWTLLFIGGNVWTAIWTQVCMLPPHIRFGRERRIWALVDKSWWSYLHRCRFISHVVVGGQRFCWCDFQDWTTNGSATLWESHFVPWWEEERWCEAYEGKKTPVVERSPSEEFGDIGLGNMPTIAELTTKRPPTKKKKKSLEPRTIYKYPTAREFFITL